MCVVCGLKLVLRPLVTVRLYAVVAMSAMCVAFSLQRLVESCVVQCGAMCVCTECVDS